MKKILIALCAVATLASCTKNEVLSYDKEAIGFENAFVDNATRSVDDPSYTNSRLFPNFQVYGYVEGAPLFNADNSGVTVAGSGINGEWNYTGTQYWIAGAHYNFSAVAPVTNGNWTKIDADKDETTLSFTNNGTTDLLYAQNDTYTAKTDGTKNGKVGFTFRHVLSKVKFSFKNAYNATSATICVRDIKITNAYETAEADLTASGTAWDNHTGTVEIAFGNATTDGTYKDHVPADTDKVRAYAYAYNTTVESYYERFLIPAAAPATDKWNITFTVDLLVSGQVIKTYNHTAKLDTTFDPGKAYDLVATINANNIDPTTSQEAIEFTVTTITDWVNAGTPDTDDDNQVDTPIQ